MTEHAVQTHTAKKRSWWHGRGDIAIGLLALATAGLLILGTVTMNVRGDSEPGPQFFPIIVILLLFATGSWVLFAALLPRRDEPDVWHRPDVSEDMLAEISGTNTEVISLEASRRRRKPRKQTTTATGSVVTAEDAAAEPSFDWRTFGLVLGAVVLFAVMLEPVGWIFSAALLFWIVSYAMGSKRPVLDLAVGLILSSLVQLAFSGGLGLSLPAGFIGWIF